MLFLPGSAGQSLVCAGVVKKMTAILDLAFQDATPTIQQVIQEELGVKRSDIESGAS